MAEMNGYGAARRSAMLVAPVLVLALAVAGCTRKEERMYFDGKYYPAKARAADKSDRKAFVVTVRRIKQGLRGAREAGRHAGMRYCLKNFGTSEIEWTLGPDRPVAQLDISGGRLSLGGRCVPW